MKRPPSYFLAAMIALAGSTLPLPAQASAWNDCQISSLAGVKKVTIIVLSGGDGVKRLGFDQEKAREDIANQLRKAGLEIEPYGSIREKLDTAALQVETHLTVIQSTDGKPLGLTYAVDSYVMDPVVSCRRQMQAPVLGVVWKSRGEHGYVNGQNLHKFTHKISDVVTEFIADWKKANPPEAINIANTLMGQAQGTGLVGPGQGLAPGHAPAPVAAAAQPIGTSAASSHAVIQQQTLIQQQQQIIARQQQELQRLLQQSKGTNKKTASSPAPGTQ